MAKTKTTTSPEGETQTEVSVGSTELANALVAAINAAKPVEKKNQFNRVVNTPWSPKDGSKKAKFKRKSYHHGLLLDESTCFNQEIELFNQLTPGDYGNGHIKVVRRRDRGIDIDYKFKTASDKLKLVNQFGIRSFAELLQFCINEAGNPRKAEAIEED